jgi:hypothetical protein
VPEVPIFAGFVSTLAQIESAAAAALIVVVVGRAVVVGLVVVVVAEMVVAGIVEDGIAWLGGGDPVLRPT